MSPISLYYSINIYSLDKFFNQLLLGTKFQAGLDCPVDGYEYKLLISKAVTPGPMITHTPNGDIVPLTRIKETNKEK